MKEIITTNHDRKSNKYNAAGRLKVDAILTTSSEYDYTANDLYFQAHHEHTPGDLNENDKILLTNPSGSGKTLLLSKFVSTGYGKSIGATWRLYDNPTITANGTALTLINRKLGSSVTSDMNVYYDPTISARGTLLQSISASDNMTTIIDVKFSIHVPANRSVLLTLDVNAKNYPVGFNAAWAEV